MKYYYFFLFLFPLIGVFGPKTPPSPRQLGYAGTPTDFELYTDPILNPPQPPAAKSRNLRHDCNADPPLSLLARARPRLPQARVSHLMQQTEQRRSTTTTSQSLNVMVPQQRRQRRREARVSSSPSLTFHSYDQALMQEQRQQQWQQRADPQTIRFPSASPAAVQYVREQEEQVTNRLNREAAPPLNLETATSSRYPATMAAPLNPNPNNVEGFKPGDKVYDDVFNQTDTVVRNCVKKKKRAI